VGLETELFLTKITGTFLITLLIHIRRSFGSTLRMTYSVILLPMYREKDQRV